MADTAFEQLKRALRQIDPANSDGAWQLITSGTVNIVGGGSGGTSMVDNNPFTPGGTSVTPLAGYQGGRQIASGNAGAVALSPSGLLLVDVRAGGAGGGQANLTVRGTANTDLAVGYASGANFNQAGGAYVPILGTVNLGAGAAPFASVAVYGSPANPVYAVGSVNVVNGSLPVIAQGGSLGVTQIGSPWGIVGSVGVTPLASFTVNQGTIATVNLGLGTVNIGNAHGIFGSVSVLGSVNIGGAVGVLGSVSVLGSVNLGAGGIVGIFGSVSMLGSVNVGGVPVVDTRGSLVPTVWPIAFAGSGYFVLAAMASAASNMRTYLYAVHATADNSAVMSFQSPSGSFLSGSIRIPGAAGWNIGGQLGHPLIIGAVNATLLMQLAGSGNVGGFAAGWIGV